MGIAKVVLTVLNMCTRSQASLFPRIRSPSSCCLSSSSPCWSYDNGHSNYNVVICADDDKFCQCTSWVIMRKRSHVHLMREASFCMFFEHWHHNIGSQSLLLITHKLWTWRLMRVEKSKFTDIFKTPTCLKSFWKFWNCGRFHCSQDLEALSGAKVRH